MIDTIATIFGVVMFIFIISMIFFFGASEGYKECEAIYHKKMIKAGCAEYNKTNGEFVIKRKETK